MKVLLYVKYRVVFNEHSNYLSEPAQSTRTNLRHHKRKSIFDYTTDEGIVIYKVLLYCILISILTIDFKKLLEPVQLAATSRQEMDKENELNDSDTTESDIHSSIVIFKILFCCIVINILIIYFQRTISFRKNVSNIIH